MPSYPSTHARQVRALVTNPSSKRLRKHVPAPDEALVKFHDYREGTHSIEDRGTVRVSQLAVGGAVRTRGVLARDWNQLAMRTSGRRDGWDKAVERHDPSNPKPAMVRSTEIRKPIVRAFTGGKATRSTDGQAQTMRDNIQGQWDALQAPYALKTAKATNKLGAGK